MLEGVPGLVINTGPKPQTRLAEPGQRVRIERHDFTLEGTVAAVGFDAARGNWLRLTRDDGADVEIAEMVRLPFTVEIIDGD